MASDAGVTTGAAGSASLSWGLLWRASLYGTLLCAASGGLYGAAFGTVMFPVIGTALGLFFGTLTGALLGLPLGLLDGILLSGFTDWYHDEVGSPNARRFRVQAGAVCATGSLLALVADWASHGLPQPNNFATARASFLVLDLLVPLTGSGGTTPVDALILIVWVLVPLLMVFCASWLNGVFVARWYAGRVRSPRPPDHGA